MKRKHRWFLLALLPLSLLFPAWRVARQRPVFLGRIKGAQELYFAPVGSRFVVTTKAHQWVLGDLGTKQFKAMGVIPLCDLDNEDEGLFSSDGSELGWVETEQIETDYRDGYEIPHPVAGDWKIICFDLETKRKVREVTLDSLQDTGTAGLSLQLDKHEISMWDDRGHIQIFSETTGKRTRVESSKLFPSNCAIHVDFWAGLSRTQIHDVFTISNTQISTEGRTAVRFDDSHAVLLDATSGHVLWRWPRIINPQFSPDGKLIVGETFNHLLVAREARTHREVWRCPLPPVSNWKLAPDDNSVVEVRGDGSLWAWPLQK